MNIGKRDPVTNCLLCGAELRTVRKIEEEMLVCPNYQDGCKLHHRPLDPTEFRAIDDAIKGAYERARDEAAKLHENINPASGKERLAGSPGCDAMQSIAEYRDAIRAMQYRPASLARLSPADEAEQVEQGRRGKMS